MSVATAVLAGPGPLIAPPGHVRFRIFVDFWNVQLTLNEHEVQSTRTPDAKFRIEWLKFPDCLVQEAVKIINASSYSYDGCIVYTSYNPKTDEGKKYHRWLRTWLDRQAGIHVNCRERGAKTHPRCPICHRSIVTCPHPGCGQNIARSIEKGVDTAIATDMIRFAWEKAFDVAILATLDADLIPAVEFLGQRGFRILQAGFPPDGIALSGACWATIDVFKIRDAFRLTTTSRP